MTLAAIEAMVAGLGRLLEAPAELLPTFGSNHDYARPEVRVDAQGYHLVVIERGQELDHQVFPALEELLFEVFEHVTFSMAGAYEVRHRIAGQDSRILLFDRQVELLARLGQTFAEKRRRAADGFLARQ